MLEQLYYLLAAQAFSFLIHHVFQKTMSYATIRILHLNVQPLYHFWDTIPGHWSPSVFYPTLPSEAEDFPRGGKYRYAYRYTSAHIPSLLPTSLINNCVLLICIKIMIVFTCGEEISILAA